jgi:hypothetical protein
MAFLMDIRGHPGWLSATGIDLILLWALMHTVYCLDFHPPV